MTPQSDASSPSACEPHEAQLCAGCLHGNTLQAHFCAKCGAPLTSYAATAPLERIWAEGHMYRSAVEQPRSWVVVAGVWMLGLAAAGAGLSFLFGGLRDFIGAASGVGLVGVGLGVGIIAWAIVLIMQTTRNYCSAKRQPVAREV